MKKHLKMKLLQLNAVIAVSMMVGAGDAHANNFSSIAKKMSESVADLPGLLAALAYLFGVLLGVLGVLKIKDHVENPGQTALKDGAIRLAAGGALFAIPMISEAMFNTIDDGGTAQQAAKLKAATFETS